MLALEIIQSVYRYSTGIWTGTGASYRHAQPVCLEIPDPILSELWVLVR